MICPHCSQNLLRRERGGRRCSKCHQPFALDPKISPLGLHDIRLRKLAERLGGGRGLRYTPVQLWYAAGRTRLERRTRFGGVRVVVTLAVIGFAIAAGVRHVLPAAAAVGLALAALVLVHFAFRAVRALFPGPVRIRIPVQYEAFRKTVCEQWVSVYGEPPPGSVDERTPLPPPIPQPRYALLCPDRSVLTCLAANNVPHDRAMVLTDRIEQLPQQVPVIVLHDASLPGLLFADHALTALRPRAVSAGLAPRRVMAQKVPAKKSAVRLGDGAPSPDDLDRLRREWLSQAEIDWLTKGWWSPIAAITPAGLLAMVDRTVERIEDKVDPERRRARAIGFLTWPTP
jgi:hypothetical protein